MSLQHAQAFQVGLRGRDEWNESPNASTPQSTYVFRYLNYLQGEKERLPKLPAGVTPTEAKRLRERTDEELAR